MASATHPAMRKDSTPVRTEPRSQQVREQCLSSPGASGPTALAKKRCLPQQLPEPAQCELLPLLSFFSQSSTERTLTCGTAKASRVVSSAFEIEEQRRLFIERQSPVWLFFVVRGISAPLLFRISAYWITTYLAGRRQHFYKVIRPKAT